jgi:hypothetical protein
MLAMGCHTAKVANPLTDKLAGNEPEAQIEFWHTLAERPLTSNDEAFHGILLYADGEDPAKDYPDRVQILKSRKMLPTSFHAQADQAVLRGDLAVAICHVLQHKGGVMMRATGQRVPRYAVRELQFIDVYPPSSVQQTFSGAEFIGIIGRIEDYQRGNSADVPAAVLPGEMKKGPTTAPAPKK